MKVSVIITTYKRSPEILFRAIESVINQTYKDTELIIVNDDPDTNISNDYVDSIISNRIEYQYVVNQTNRGACYSRNVGIDISNGEIIGFLDDDDTWDMYKIEKMISFFNNSKISLVYCDFIIHDNNKKKYISFEKNFNSLYKDIYAFNCIGGCSIPLIRKKSLIEAGKFDEQFKSAQDLDLWIRILKIGEAILVKEALVNYYVTSDAITSNLEKRLQGFDLLCEKYKHDYNGDKYDQKQVIIFTEIQLCGQYFEFRLLKKYFLKLDTVNQKIKALFYFAKGVFKNVINRGKIR